MEDIEILENEGIGRNALQPLVMTAIYDVLTHVYMDEAVDVEMIVSSLSNLPYSECDFFLKAEVISVVKHLGEMKDAYRPYLRKWTFERLNRLEQAILLQSYAHYYYVEPEVEKGVVIDIAIKLAKKYLSENDYKFVNAILDNVLGDR